MTVDKRSIRQINEDIKTRVIYLGRVIIMKKIAIILALFSFILSIYNIIKWIMNDLNINSRCILIIIWMFISIIGLLIYNSLQSFSISLKQSIYNDKKILSKL